MSNLSSPYSDLVAVVEELHNDLQDYKKQPKSSEYVVKKREKLINDLIDVVNKIEVYNYNAIGCEIVEEINKIRVKDSEADTIFIRLELVPNGQKTAFLTVKNYKV